MKKKAGGGGGGGDGTDHYKKGLWTEEEDKILQDYIKVHGKGQWNSIAKNTGLKRCGKSCRLRWMNYLSPNVKHGNFTEEEEDLIIRLHNLLGNRWSLIAKRVPGRTDNQVKNYWNTHVTKKLAVKEQNCKVGIRKQSSSRSGVAVSSSENTRPAVELSKTDTNLELNLCGSSTNSNIEVTDDHQGTLQEGIEEVASDQEPLIKDSCLNSFWFSDDLELLGDFSMEFLDGYSFNFD